LVLWITAPKESAEAREARGVTIVPQLSPDGAGFTAVGHF
jgi:hypothetical protein